MSFPYTCFLLYVSCYSLEAVYEKYKGDRGRFELSKRTSDPFQTERPFFSVRIQVRAFSVNYYIFILFFAGQSNPGKNGIYRFFNAV